MPKLICKKVSFLSENDELMFFEWISRIKAIKKTEGKGDEIYLHLPRLAVSDTTLRELTALFYRYSIEMKQLQQFVNDKNREWYADSRKYWHKRVFGKKGA